MPIEEQIVSKAPPFGDRVPRDDGGPEKRARVHDARVPPLAFEGHRFARLAATLGKVDAAVARGAEEEPATLERVRAIEVVAREHRVAPREARRHRVEIG